MGNEAMKSGEKMIPRLSEGKLKLSIDKNGRFLWAEKKPTALE